MIETATPVALSSDQQRLWFAHRTQNPGPALNVPFAFRMTARFGEDALRAAVECVERRHDALRLRIADDGGVPRGELRAEPAAPVDVHPLAAGLDWPGVLLQARRFAALPFDPAADPLLRVGAFVHAPDDWLLVVVMHHLVCDAASANVVAGDLLRAFGMAARGDVPRLPPVAKPYRALLAEREAAAEAARAAGHREFWRAELAQTDLQWSVTDPRVAAPPAALPGPGELPECRVTFDLPAGLGERIDAFARGAKASSFMVFLAAYAALLRRWSRIEDAAILIPVSQRKAPEDREVVGLWANTVPIRCTFAARTTYRELVGQLRRRVLEAIRHDLPFGDIVSACAPARDPLALPISRAMFTLQTDTPGDPGGAAVSVDVDTGATQAELTLFVWTGAGGPRCGLEFDRHIGAANAGRMARCFVTLLGALVERPDAPVDELPLLDAELERAALSTGNDTAFAYPDDARIEELFARTVAAGGERLALADGVLAFTYAELDAAAESLCAVLRPAVAPADRVAVTLERSAAWVVAVLAILKCGATYVALDGAMAAERVRAVLDEVAPAAVIVPAAGAERFASYAPFCVAVDEAGGAVAVTGAARARRADPVRPSARDVAYVCYTSGSSGKPKGIEVEHRGVVRLVRDTNYIRIEPADRVALATAVTFDVVTFDIWAALLNGAALIVVRRETMLEPAKLSAFVRERGLSVLFVTTALFNVVARSKPGAFRPLRALLFGGERADPAAVAAVASAEAKPRHLLHLYGPTEVTTFALWHEVSGAPAAGDVPIGLPIGNTTAYVLDAHLQPLPPNVVGELYLGGPGVARGYLGRAALTAERFVPDPFAGRGERMYRSGDLAYRDEAGRIVFTGRADRQIKLRGFRIEPAEIERALRSLAGVRDALVVHVPESAGREPFLSAYVICEPGTAVDRGGWREALRSSLPDYMIPVAYTEVPAFPLTLNGKIDLARLPAPTGAPGPASTGVPGPGTTSIGGSAPEADAPAGGPYETAVVEAFREAFALSAVAPDDDFFELGGHSLIALRVVAGAGRATGRSIDVRAVFELRTPRAIAAALAHAPDAGARDHAAEDADDTPAPLTPTQEQMVLLEAVHPDGRQNIPLVFRLREPLDPHALREAWNGLVAAHGMLRAAIRAHDGSLAQGPFAPPPELLLHERVEAGFEAAFDEVRAFVRAPFDLAAGPPARAALFALRHAGGRVTDAILAVVVHHVAFDGASQELLLAELFARHAAAVEGRRYEAPRPRQFLAYARAAARRDPSPDLAYWQGVLDGFPLERRLFRAPAAAEAGDMRYVDLRPLVTQPERAVAVASALGMTPYVVAAAALACALRATHGVDDVLLGSPFSLRESDAFDSAIGPFVVSAPLRVRVPESAPVRAFLSAVRASVADAHAHLGVPAERLLLEAGAPAGRSFDVWLAVHRAQTAGTGAEHVRLEELDLTAPAKYPVRIDWTLGERGSFGLSYDPEAVEPERAADLARAFAAALGALASPAAGSTAEVLSAVVRALREERSSARNERAAGPHPILGARRRIAAAAPLAAAPLTAAPLIASEGTTRREAIDAVFVRVARAQPDAIALAHDERVMTYRELERRSRALAHLLVARGVTREQPVGVLVERSFELAIALLAILRAGGAFVPLDPTAPPARNQYVRDDCRLRLVVADRRAIARLGNPGETAVVFADEAALADDIALTDEAARAAAAQLENEALPACAPEGLAYVLYTSGSTGSPKGVLCLHGAVTVLANALAGLAGFGPGARVVQFSAINFDVSVGEIFGALLNGATLVLAQREDLMPGSDLAAVLERTRATTLLITPSALALVPVRPFPALRTIVVAGESCHPAVVRPWLPGRRVINAYGPTEGTVYATSYELPAADGPSVPIGVPLAGAAAYLLDADLVPVADGGEGELYIGGTGVARGYAGRPAQTAASFLPDPFAGVPGARMYKTGDVCVRENGLLTFLRRDDGQLKLNGIRIEPGEIEALLLATELVRSAAAGVLKNADGDAELVVAVLRPPDGASVVDPLRDALARRLPPAMMPRRIVVVDAFPTTPSGKIDRRTLFAALAGADDGPSPDAGPSETLGEVRAAFCRRLEADAESDTDFFAAGGTSLAAARLLSELGGRFGVELRYRAFFAEPTANAVARAIDASLRDRPAVPAAPRAPSFTRNQQRLFLLERLWPGTNVHNVPVPFELRGPLDVERLCAAFGTVVAGHDELCRSFELDEHGASRPLRFVTPDVRVLDAPGADPRALAARFAEVPLNLEREAPVRLVVARTAPERFAVLVLAHHIVFDARSREIFVERLARAYRGEDVARAPGRSAVHERVPAPGYWREYLRGLPPEQVPLGALDPAKPPWPARCAVRAVSPAAAAAAEAAFLGQGLLSTTGYAAFVAAALRDELDARDVVVGIPVEPRASREAQEIGFHSTFVPLRFDTRERAPFDPDLLKAANDALLEGIDAPPDFEDLLQLVPRGGRRVSSFCDVVLVGGEPLPRLDLGRGIAVTPFEVPLPTARFPLQFSLERDAAGAVRALRLEYQIARCSDAQAELIADGAVRALERYLVETRPADGGAERAAGTGSEQADPASEAVREIVRGIWRDLVGSELEDEVNFFDAGVSSLGLMQLHARLQPLFPALDIMDLFVNTTLGELTAHLAAAELAPSGAAAAPAPGRN